MHIKVCKNIYKTILCKYIEYAISIQKDLTDNVT